MLGLHITGDFYRCECNQDALIDPQNVLRLIRDKIKQCRLTALQDCSYRFASDSSGQSGFTIVFLLAESHISLHTWPEHSYASMDVYVCNYRSDNSQVARELVKEIGAFFRPRTEQQHELLRGEEHAQAPDGNSGLHLEWLSDTAAFGFKATACLERRRSSFQFIEVLDCPEWGKTLRLDHRYMTSEAEGFIYHELMVHPAMATHRSPSSVLILGGGDGGTLNEVLKYRMIESVDLVELDEAVVSVAKQYFSAVNGNAFDDSRVRVHIEDAQNYVARSSHFYDAVFLDLTDERPPAEHLYDDAFFALLRSRLTSKGIIVLHCGAPYFEAEAVANILRRVRKSFSIVRPFGAYIPLYGTYLSFAIASQTIDPVGVCQEDVAEWLNGCELRDLRYYNPEIHAAAFAIPNFLRKALA